MILDPPRPKLLFIAPIMPSKVGNGLAIRAGTLLDAWSRRFEVTLYVVPAAGGGLHPTAFAVERTARIGVLDGAGLEPQAALIERLRDPIERRRQRRAYPRPWMARYSGEAAFQCMAAWLGNDSFSMLHVMRLYLAPLACRFLQGAHLPAVLDLDEDDARLHDNIARLHERAGQRSRAVEARAEARHYARLAASSLGPLSGGAFRAVLTASAVEARRLAAQWPGMRFAAVPNVPPAVPARRRLRRSVTRPLRLLLVGNFGYAPNVDAARHMVRDVLPLLRRHLPEVEITLVGAGGTNAMLGSGDRRAGVSVHGFAPDLGAFYAKADIAVVPLRVGGGTRIKILEAFAHQVPVVATRVGAEGLHVVNGRHILLADGPRPFVQACMRLHRCPALRTRLVQEAASLRASRHSPACVTTALNTFINRSD